MKTIKIIRTTLIQVTACFCLLLTIYPAVAEPIVIRLSHVVSPDAPKGKMATKFQNLVRERVGDEKVIVEVYPNSELFSDSKVLEAMLNGKVEIAVPSLSKVKKYSKRFQVFDLPFVFVSPVAAEKFLAGPYGDRLLRTLNGKGFYGLGYLNNGMRQLSANKQISWPTDVEGLTYRYSGSDIAKTWLETAGAEPVKLSFSKVYGALKAKEIDGQMNVWSNIFSKKFYEHQKFIVESNHSYLSYMIVASNEFWKRLPDDLRVVLEKSMDDAISYANEIARQKVIADRQAIIDTGLATVYPLTVEQRQAWTDAMLPVWRRFENEIGSELIQAAASQR